MKSFEDAVASIQVGIHKGDPVRSGLLEPYITASVERTALVELGTMDLMRRAGIQTTGAIPLPASPPDPSRIAQFGDALDDAFAMKASEVVFEWVEFALIAGFIAPPQALPTLLALPKKSLQIVKPILGERGKWLAGLMGITLDEGSEESPAEARLMLAEEYETLSQKQIVQCLNSISEHVAHDDEPLLMKAFADSRKDVRLAAVEGLVKIPLSVPAMALSAIVEKSVSVRRSLLMRIVEFHPPTVAVVPDWLPQPKAKSPYGPLGIALQEICGRVPPNLWVSASGLKPNELLEEGLKSDYSGPLFAGWQAAAIRFSDAEWANAIFDRGTRANWPIDTELLRLVSEAAFEWRTLVLLGQGESQLLEAMSFIVNRKRTLSPNLSKSVLDAVRKRRSHSKLFYGPASYLDLSIRPYLDEPWEEFSPAELVREHWRKILDVRYRLLLSIQ